MSDKLTFDSNEMNQLQTMIEGDDLNGVAYLMSEKIQDYFDLSAEMRNKYFEKLKVYLNNYVNKTYIDYKGKTLDELKQELEANLQGYVGMMEINGFPKDSKPPSEK